MLSEKRRKVKYSTNPNGNLWANNTSGFGRSMLEKMGWAPGQGLGKNSDGIKIPIKTSTQKGKKGLGLKIDYSLGIKQMDEYAELLRTLNKSVSSLSTSQSSSVDVIKGYHSGNAGSYGKTILAKDASKYDKKSLSAIFGISDIPNETSFNCESIQAAGSYPDKKEHGVNTYNSQLSIAEYFKLVGKADQSLKSNKLTDDQENSILKAKVNRKNRKISKSFSLLTDKLRCSSSDQPVSESESDQSFTLIKSNDGSQNARDATEPNITEFSSDCVFFGSNLLTLSGYPHY